MPTETFVIRISERGAAAAGKSIAAIGRTARTAGIAVGVLGGALTALGLAAVAKDAIETSAAFQKYGVTLRALLGSQREANVAIENFTKFSQRTPFAVGQIVSGATALAGAALGNRERLEELTATAGNLAAITGLSFQESASNLARSLQAGIAAADLFREKGVRSIIESVAGIPDATKLSTQELEQVFQETFGAGGVFGNAAEALSFTLGGAISNLGDAAEGLQKQLGDALSPVVVNSLREVIIPFLNDLKRLVSENEEEIRTFAGEVIAGLIRGFIEFARVGLTVVQTFSDLAQGFRLLRGATAEFRLSRATAELEQLEQAGNNPFAPGEPQAAPEVIERQRREVARLREEVDRYALAAQQGERSQERLNNVLDAGNGALANLDRLLTNAENRPGGLSADRTPETPDVNLPTGDNRIAGSVEETQKLEDATEKLRLERLQGIEPLRAQLRVLEAQEAEILSIAGASDDFAASSEALGLIAEKRAALEAKIATETERQSGLLATNATLQRELSSLAPEYAAEMERATQAVLEAGGGLEEVNKEIAGVNETAKRELERAKKDQRNVGREIGSAVKAGVNSGLRQALSEGGVDFAEQFSRISSDLLSKSLNSMLDQLGAKIDQLLSGVGGNGRLGDALGAAAGLGFALVSSALSDTETAVSNNLAQSAATASEQATRGVVAGPTSIPIFQVGSAIEAAFEPTNEILRDILAAVLSQNDALALGSGAVGSSDPGALLGNQAPALA